MIDTTLLLGCWGELQRVRRDGLDSRRVLKLSDSRNSLTIFCGTEPVSGLTHTLLYCCALYDFL